MSAFARRRELEQRHERGFVVLEREQFRVERERERRRSYWLHGKSFKGLHIPDHSVENCRKECGLVGRKRRNTVRRNKDSLKGNNETYRIFIRKNYFD